MEELLWWFENLAVELRQDIAALTFIFLPEALIDAEPHADDESITDKYSYTKFRERLTRWGTGMPSQHAGTAVAVAAIIDVILVNRDGADDWADAKAFMEHVSKNPQLADFATEKLEQMPLRQRRWMQAAKEWSALRNGALAPTAISEWLKRQRG